MINVQCTDKKTALMRTRPVQALVNHTVADPKMGLVLNKKARPVFAMSELSIGWFDFGSFKSTRIEGSSKRPLGPEHSSERIEVGEERER
jgi:hypothetical protein